MLNVIYLAALPEEVKQMITEAFTFKAARTYKRQECSTCRYIGKDSLTDIQCEKWFWIKKITAEEPIDSRWDIGSPTYFTAFLKYESWLNTFSAYNFIKQAG